MKLSSSIKKTNTNFGYLCIFSLKKTKGEEDMRSIPYHSPYKEGKSSHCIQQNSESNWM